MTLYPALPEDYDDGTMPANVEAFANALIGHKIIKVDRMVRDARPNRWVSTAALRLTLDNGDVVSLYDTDDCCAYTALLDVIEKLPTVEHIITRVSPSEDYDEWHILADFGEVMELKVGWSCGNPFYYGYGFDIHVEKATGK